MSLIDDDNNIALALGGGVAVATDDPELLSDNNLNKEAKGTNQESDRSNAAGDDQAIDHSAADDSVADTSGGSTVNNDGSDDNGNNRNNDTASGPQSAADGDSKYNDLNASTGAGNSTADGNVNDQDDTNSFNDTAGAGDFSPGDGDSKYNDGNGDGDLRAADDGDVKYNDQNNGGNYSTADGDVWDKSGDNRDNEDKSGSFRDFDELIDFDDATFGPNDGAWSANASPIYLEGGGVAQTNNQVANIKANGNATGNYDWHNDVNGAGGDGGEGGGANGQAGDGGDGGGGQDCCFDPCEAKMLADSCERYDNKPKSPDPCCDDGTFGDGGDGGAGRGGTGGEGGYGGAGGYGFEIKLGDATSSASGGGGGGAEDGSSANNTSSSAGHTFEAWNNNVIVGANVINQDFSPLIGDVG
jgi:hypothetical protein